MIDLLTCYLGVRRARRGTGASGVPLLTLPLYGYLIARCGLGTFHKLLAFVAAAAVHTILVFVIPSRVGLEKK